MVRCPDALHREADRVRGLRKNAYYVNAGRGSDAPHSILPLPGGGIQVEWRGEAGNIEVEVSSEGVLGYLLTRGSGATREFEERDSLSQLQIIALVRSVIG